MHGRGGGAVRGAMMKFKQVWSLTRGSRPILHPSESLRLKVSITQNIINATTTSMGRNKGGMHKQKKIS